MMVSGTRYILLMIMIFEILGEGQGNCTGTVCSSNSLQMGYRSWKYIWQGKKNPALLGTEAPSSSNQEEWVSREGPLAIIAEKYLRFCTLTIFYQQETSGIALTLRRNLPYHGIKMYQLTSQDLLKKVTWSRSQCDGYLFLLTGDGHPLVRHASIDHFKAVPYKPGKQPPPLWNYKAYYVILLLEPSSLEPVNLIRLYNFKKTENLVILQERADRLRLWTHSLLSQIPSLEYLDTWYTGKFLTRTNLFPRKFENFKGFPLLVATFEHPPSVVYPRDAEENVIGKIGVDMELIRGLAQAKNFTVKFIEVSFTEKWGQKFENGSWDGLMREVYDEYVDIGVCNVFIDYYRYGEIDYSYPYNFMPGCFVTPSPKPLSNWQSPSLPFSRETWISIGISFLLGGPILYFIVVPLLNVNPEPLDFKSLSYNYLFILASLTIRSVNIVPKYWPGRFYAGFAWLSCLIISTAYSANLIAFLSVTQMSKPIDTLADFVKSGLRLGGHSFWKTQFELSPDAINTKLASMMESDVDFVSVFDQVEAGEFAFVENRQFLELNRDSRYTYGGQSTIRIVKECFVSYNIALILPRYSPLTDNLANNLMRIFESGMMRKWQGEVIQYFRKRYASKRLGKKFADPSEKRPLNLEHVQSMFYILGFGYLCSSILLIFEIFCRREQDTRKK
ncbi:hypothetical protein SK128_010284 [Halocaridina rubra]|uniref:Ionotropic glutamate receptor L-glutamate and glycine-binding domain-containing protein n=1 Tax=Halocaridina rubra TaxID=373956 RepID=A0AAN9AG73_HALRR